MWSNPTHISSTFDFGSFHDRVLYFAFPVHTSNWFMPRFDLESSAVWRIPLGFEHSTSALLEQVDRGRRCRTCLASDGLLYHFSSFSFFLFLSFPGDLFPFDDSN